MPESPSPAKSPAAESTPNDPAKPATGPNWQKVGIGAAIGSAAIVAALLYANRPKPKGHS
jgi:hypothetical protein